MPHKQVHFREAARENAVSVASLLLLTEATLTEVPAKDEEKSPVGD